MNLSFKVAWRYLFARKSTNAINIITGISVFGVAIQTAAFVLVLSVLNGFESLLLSLFNNFNPEVKVSLIKGKTFSTDSINWEALNRINDIAHYSKTLEELAFFDYRANTDFGTIKGVDTSYIRVSNVDSTIREGSYALQLGEMSFAVMGGGMRDKLRVNMDDDFTSINVYMPKSGRIGALEQPYRRLSLYPMGVFRLEYGYDQEYILTNLSFVQRLLDLPNQISAIEVKLKPNSDEQAIIQAIQKVVGDKFKVQNQYQQEEAYLKVINVEKWLTFAILTLTLLLIAFNLIGSLWMIVLEKKKDISILKSMGIQNRTIRAIFLYEGGLICILGLTVGFMVSLTLVVLQKSLGIIPLPDGFAVDAYPVTLEILDFIAIVGVVFLIGFLASLPAALNAEKVPAMVREE